MSEKLDTSIRSYIYFTHYSIYFIGQLDSKENNIIIS